MDRDISFIREQADSLDHVVVPKPRIRKLRFYETMFLKALEALTKDVVAECKSHGVGTDAWENGILDELRFWWEVTARNANPETPNDFRQSFLLQHDFSWAGLFSQNPSKTIEALDMGCALRPAIGKRFPGREVNIVAADPLATGYKRILELFGIEREYELQFAVAEKTSEIFGPERFDFILAKNSIDHGYDPCTAFASIAAALKPGGAAYFEHFRNEAEGQNYAGFHQWNLEAAGDGMVRVWNRETDNTVDFEKFGCTATVRKRQVKKRAAGKIVDAFDVTLVKR